MSDRELILEVQNKALEDRLAMALSIMQCCEIECGIAGDAEGADWWEQSQRMLIGKDDEALNFARDEQRRYGNFYKRSLTDVRAWLQRGIDTILSRAANKEKKAA